MNVKYRVRVVKCRDCGKVLDYLDGERTNRTIPAHAILQKNLVRDPGEVQCPSCGGKNYYEGNDVDSWPVFETAAVV